MATKVIVSFEVDNAGAVSKIQQVKKELNDVPQSTARATSGLLTLKQALVGVASSFVAIKLGQFMRESIQGAIEEQQVMTRLAATLASLGIRYGEVSVELQGFFDRIQATTRFSDDQAAAAFQKLAIVTGSYESALKLLGPVLDLAVGGTMDLETAATLAGKAATGYIGILARYGIVLDDATQKQIKLADASEKAEIIARVLNERFGGQAQADVKSYAGQIAQLSNNWSNLQETLGAALLGMVRTQAGTSSLVEALRWLRDVVIEVAIGWKFTLESTWSYIKTYFAAYVQAIRTFKDTITSLWQTGLTEGIFGASSGSMTTAIIAGIQTFRTELDLLDQQLSESLIWDVADVEKYRQSIQNLTIDTGNLVDVVGGDGGGGGDSLNGAFLSVSPTAGRFAEIIRMGEAAFISAGSAAADYARILRDSAGMTMTVFDPWVQAADWQVVEDAAEDTFDVIGDSFSDMLGRGFMGELEDFGDLWDEIWQDLAKRMAGFIGDAFEGLLSGEGGAFGNLATQLGSLGGTIAGMGMVGAGYHGGGRGGGDTEWCNRWNDDRVQPRPDVGDRRLESHHWRRHRRRDRGTR